VDFGWHLPCYGRLATRENLILVAREAETRGFESVFVSDHVALPFEPKTPYGSSRTGTFPVPPTDSFLEPLTALALVAAVTERVKLGTTALVLPHRHLPRAAAHPRAGHLDPPAPERQLGGSPSPVVMSALGLVLALGARQRLCLRRAHRLQGVHAQRVHPLQQVRARRRHPGDQQRERLG
jgi:Luciferase-like monooxygenase